MKNNEYANTFTYALRIFILKIILASPPEESDGIEMLVALEYVRHHNMSVDIIVNYEDLDQWGEAFENWTGTGVVGNLVADKGDIGFGNT